MRLGDHIAVVTGAGNGIGKAIAIALAAAGAQVVVVDIQAAAGEQTAKVICDHGDRAVAFSADVSDLDSVEDLGKRVIERFGKLHVLVNNAAIQISKTVVDTTPEEWNRQMAVNVGGVFLCSRRFLPHLRETRGVIINLSSVNGFFVEPACAGYCTTKAAIIGLTKAMAIDHGREGVRVHAICPGYIDAGLAESYFQSQSDPMRARAEAGSLHALGRIGRPEEVARLAVFLASEEASFMTGSAVIVDGGFSAGLPPQRRVVMQLTTREIDILQNTFLDYRSIEDFIQNPLVLQRAHGLYYWDTAGKRYFDAIGGVFVAILGHGHPRVLAAMREQMERMTFAPPLHGIADVTLDFVERLGSICPANLRFVKPFSGGSEAVESAFKFARQYFKQTGRQSARHRP